MNKAYQLTGASLRCAISRDLWSPLRHTSCFLRLSPIVFPQLPSNENDLRYFPGQGLVVQPKPQRANPRRMNSYEKCACNSRRICTYKNKGLKVEQNQQLQKTEGGGVGNTNREVADPVGNAPHTITHLESYPFVIHPDFQEMASGRSLPQSIRCFQPTASHPLHTGATRRQ